MVIQASNPPLEKKFYSGGVHGLVLTFLAAYNNHCGVELSPDHVWLAVCQGFCSHIENNANELRSFFVDFEGKKKLTVRCDDFVYGSADNDWPSVFQ